MIFKRKSIIIKFFFFLRIAEQFELFLCFDELSISQRQLEITEHQLEFEPVVIYLLIIIHIYNIYIYIVVFTNQ